LLSLKKVNVYYDKVAVIKSVELYVNDKEIVAILGANGAGKSTLLRVISGLKKLATGEIEFLNERIDTIAPHKIVEKGIIHVPEGRKIFPSLTVLENLQLGAYTPKAKSKREKTLQEAFDLFPVLKERKNQLGGTLSGGEQQMLAIARGLMGLPQILMLDEPSLGLAPIMVKEMFRVVNDINSIGTTILLVEQNVFHSLQISNRGYVLENGSIVFEGKSKALLGDENVKKAYLGM
jgi:branched-chain amino acid transport system ATP-binding protein